jgi:rubrerythrin
MELLNIHQLLDFAVQLEINGEKFFLHWAEKSKDESISKFFKFLAEEESAHKKTFENLKQKLGDAPPEIQPSDEYDEYFKTFIGDIVLNEKEVKQINDLSTALEFAKKMELDSLLFFTELRNFTAKENWEIITKIIEEERRHFMGLSKLKQKLTGEKP